MSKLIAVVGATGNQGGSVASTFLSSPGWTVRAITRNTSSPKAQALASRGAELFKADLDDSKSLEEAFRGANAIFVVSDFWGIYGDPANQDKRTPEQPLNVYAYDREVQQLKNAIDAAAANIDGLDRFVLSSLADVTKWSGGKYTHVYHFDSKAHAEAYGKETHPELWKKTSIFQAGLFLSNFVENPSMPIVKNNQDIYEFASKIDTDLKLPIIAAEDDSGPIVKALVDAAPGKNIIGYRQWFTIQELAEAFTKVTGLKSQAVRIPDDTQLPFPEELSLEFHDNFGFFNEFGYEARDDPTIIHPKDLDASLQLDTVEDYILKNDWATRVPKQ